MSVSARRRALRGLIVLVGLCFIGVSVLLPVVLVFVEAFAKGTTAYLEALQQADTVSALKLTLLTAAIAVPLNTLFGLAAAWCIARFDFPGRGLLVTLIDLPLSVSPVISGLAFVLIFGRQGVLGPTLLEHGWRVVFAVPGIVLATVFVTFPLVARELIPVLQAMGTEEEEAARSLGASGWAMFRRVTLPGARWGLLYGAILCNARAMGEYGAVSVVSGKVRGETNTLPLHVEVLYGEYDFQAAFAVASVLALLAIATLVVKAIVEARTPTRYEGGR